MRVSAWGRVILRAAASVSTSSLQSAFGRDVQQWSECVTGSDLSGWKRVR